MPGRVWAAAPAPAWRPRWTTAASWWRRSPALLAKRRRHWHRCRYRPSTNLGGAKHASLPAAQCHLAVSGPGGSATPSPRQPVRGSHRLVSYCTTSCPGSGGAPLTLAATQEMDSLGSTLRTTGLLSTTATLLSPQAAAEPKVNDQLAPHYSKVAASALTSLQCPLCGCGAGHAQAACLGLADVWSCGGAGGGGSAPGSSSHGQPRVHRDHQGERRLSTPLEAALGFLRAGPWLPVMLPTLGGGRGGVPVGLRRARHLHRARTAKGLR